MKTIQVIFLTCMLLIGNALISKPLNANALIDDAIALKFANADITIIQFNDVRASVFTFFDENAAFPLNLPVLTDPANLYYSGNTTSPFGTGYSGGISADGRFFEITLDLLTTEVADYVAARINTQATGTSVTLAVGTPASQTLYTGVINRNLDPLRPELNEMNTHLSLGGNNINNVVELNATRINIAALASVDELDAVTGITTKELTATGSTSLRNTAIAGTLSATGTATLAAANFSGNANFADTASFNKAVAFSGTTSFADAATFAKSVGISENVTIGGTLAVTGDVTAGNVNTTKLTADVVSSIDADIVNLVVSNSSTLGNASATDVKTVTLTATGSAQLLGGLSVDGQTTLGGATTLNGATTANSTFTAQLGINLANSDTNINQGANQSLRISNITGFVDIGTSDSALVEFKTDADGYIFDKKVKVQDVFEVAGGSGTVKITSADSWLTLDSSSSGGNATDQAAGISIGESGYKGSAALHLTYTGDGYGHIGMGSVVDAIPTYEAMRLHYKSRDVSFLGAITSQGRIYAKDGLHVKGDWLRVDGDNGVYFQKHGGGWHMEDSDWIRAYNDKAVMVNNVVRADGGFQVDGKWIASADGNTLYENSVALNEKYLGITAKAADADKLDGLDSSSFIPYKYRIHKNDKTSPDNFTTSNRYQTFNYGVSSGVTGPLLSFGGLGTKYPMQLTGAYYGGNTFKVRTSNNSKWNPWRTLWHNGNDGSGSGLDADKLDGYSSGSFGKLASANKWTLQQTMAKGIIVHSKADNTTNNLFGDDKGNATLQDSAAQSMLEVTKTSLTTTAGGAVTSVHTKSKITNKVKTYFDKNIYLASDSKVFIGTTDVTANLTGWASAWKSYTCTKTVNDIVALPQDVITHLKGKKDVILQMTAGLDGFVRRIRGDGSQRMRGIFDTEWKMNANHKYYTWHKEWSVKDGQLTMPYTTTVCFWAQLV